MEALAAIALAGNVLQFAEFVTKLLTSAGELYDKKDLTSNVRIQESIERIQGLARAKITQSNDFKIKLRHAVAPETLPPMLQETDIMVVELCRECIGTAQNLSNVLNKLKLPENRPASGWRSLLAAVKSVWSEQEIAAQLNSMKQIQASINSTVLVSLSAKVDFVLIQQSEKFKHMSNENQAIVSALLDSQERTMTDFKSQISALSLLLSRAEVVISQHKTSMRHLVTDAMQPLLGPQWKSGENMLNKIRNEELQLRREVTQTILDSLAFESIQDRFEGIEEAHEETFNWIFQPDRHLSVAEDDVQPASFTKWLEEQSGVYWVNGKAASGKSTLMKYILAHSDTQRLLQRWADSSETRGALRFASFFFWASGTKEQRSQTGLLRSILYELLVQEPDLVPVLFPKQWSIRYTGALGFIFENDESQVRSLPAFPTQKFSWALSILKKALQTLAFQEKKPFQICLFVDGLDEYEGDETEIANLFAQISTSSRIKCCVSSRPHKPFIDSFSGGPNLRLQDLTFLDIRKYVSDKLESDARMRQLAIGHAQEVQALITEIVTSASGVFLWVRLVVSSLLKGLGNDDSVDDLQARLRVLPKDLESLYRHMILRVDEVYEQESSRIFLIVGAATTPRQDDWAGVSPPTALGLYFAVEDHKTRALEAPMGFCTKEDINIWCKSMISKLVTRCGGLLEAQASGRGGYAKAKITYMHRTAKDFIQKPENEELFRSRSNKTPKSRFFPDFAILKAMVLVLKAQERVELSGYADTILNIAIMHARRVETVPSVPREAANMVLDELIQTAYKWIKISSSSRKQIFYPGCTNYTIAVQCGLYQYVRYLLQQKNIIQDGSTKKGTRSLLDLAMHPGAEYEIYRRPRMIESLVEFGADPYQAFSFTTNYMENWLGNDKGSEDNEEDEDEAIFAEFRSIILKLIPLQHMPALQELRALRYMHVYPDDWNDVWKLIETSNAPQRTRNRERISRMFRWRT